MIFREEDFIPINFPFSSLSWATKGFYRETKRFLESWRNLQRDMTMIAIK